VTAVGDRDLFPIQRLIVRCWLGERTLAGRGALGWKGRSIEIIGTASKSFPAKDKVSTKGQMYSHVEMDKVVVQRLK
jgi:hypothetical protein